MDRINFAEIARQSRLTALATRAARRAESRVANHDFAPVPVVPMAVSSSGRLHLVA